VSDQRLVLSLTTKIPSDGTDVKLKGHYEDVLIDGEFNRKKEVDSYLIVKYFASG
jgi:hypothetical protein